MFGYAANWSVACRSEPCPQKDLELFQIDLNYLAITTCGKGC